MTVGLADADPGMTVRNADENTRRLPAETGAIDVGCRAVCSWPTVRLRRPGDARCPRRPFCRVRAAKRSSSRPAAHWTTVWKAAGLGAAPGGGQPVGD